MAYLGLMRTGVARLGCMLRNAHRLRHSASSHVTLLKQSRTIARQGALDLAESVTVSPSVPRLQFGVSEDRGLRKYMEDRHTVLRAGLATPCGRIHSQTNIAAVFDGHGGQVTADYVSSHLPQEVASHPLFQIETGNEADEESFQDAFKAVYSNVDKEMREAARLNPAKWKDGSTALVAVQHGRTLYTANAGDCRAVLCRNGQGHRLTQDHTPNDAGEQHRIRKAGGNLRFGLGGGGWRVIGNNNISLSVSRGMGDFAFKEPRCLVSSEPDVVATHLAPGDAFVILASDGLWAVMDDGAAVGIAADLLSGCTVMNGSGWQASDFWARMAAKALVDEAVSRGTSDNVTALVVLLDWSN